MAQSSRLRSLIRMSLSLIVLFIVVATLFVLGCQRAVIYPRYVIGQPPLTGPPADAVRLTAEAGGGEVEAWLLPANGEVSSTPRAMVVFFHGNAELIDHNIDWAQTYRDMGMHVLLVEYRGYGRSGGSPSQSGRVSDAGNFVRQAAAREDVDAERIIFHGRSLGGGVACAAANLAGNAAAIILESAFTRTADMAGWVPPLLILDKYDNLAALSAFDGPVLLMHGRLDEVVPYAHAERLHDAARRSTLVTFDTTHNTMLLSDADVDIYWNAIVDFLIEHGIIEQNGTRSIE